MNFVRNYLALAAILLTCFSFQCELSAGEGNLKLFRPEVFNVTVINQDAPETLKIYGKRFGNKLGRILFGGKVLDSVVSWEDKYIEVDLPNNILPGTYKLVVDSVSISGNNKGTYVTIGAVGPQGIQGPKGEQGIQGIQGIQGVQGPQGEVGPQGDVGPQGERGLTGAQGPQGIKGDRGPQGVKGDRGPQGEPGIAPSELQDLKSRIKKLEAMINSPN